MPETKRFYPLGGEQKVGKPSPTSKAARSSESLQRLRARHYKMIDMLVAGCTNKEIAEVVGCTPTTVSACSRSPMFQKELHRRQTTHNDEVFQEEAAASIGKAQSILEQNSESASNVQIELLESEDDSVRLRASNSILDRVLGKPEGKGSSGGPVVNVQINAEHAQLLTLALKESTDAPRFKIEESVPDVSDARPSEDGHAAVHQASPVSPGE